MIPPENHSAAAAGAASPCVRNCCLDEHEVCVGCGRHIEEILRWHQASASERDDILAAARSRLEQRRPGMP